jgi:hypothetical protein
VHSLQAVDPIEAVQEPKRLCKAVVRYSAISAWEPPHRLGPPEIKDMPNRDAVVFSFSMMFKLQA